MACGVGVIQVDRVLGQNGDDPQDRNRQTTRDVDLSSFSRPRQQEAGRHDRGTVGDQAQNRTRIDTGDAQHQGRADEEGDDSQ
jgi:hypothetical protein